MDFEFQLQTSKGEIYFWKVEKYSTRIAAGEKKRIIERSEVRNKLESLGYNNELKYKESGQPYLNELEGTFLSISHSNGMIAIYIASQKVGIDVEFERKSMFEGRSYFVNQEEEEQDLTQDRLQLIWGAKEAFYKQMEGQIQDLKNEVTVLTINSSTKTINLRFQNKVIELKFEIFNETYVVFS